MLCVACASYCFSLAPERAAQTEELIGFVEIVNNNQNGGPGFEFRLRSCFWYKRRVFLIDLHQLFSYSLFALGRQCIFDNSLIKGEQ